jgi:fructose-1,6-bisphosphatase I
MRAGQGVRGFTFDPQIGEFVLTHPEMRIPVRRSIYSVNDGNYFSWDTRNRAYIDHIKQVDKATARPYRCARQGGAG